MDSKIQKNFRNQKRNQESSHNSSYARTELEIIKAANQLFKKR